jgi:ElaB/YqjD/DUF883 family membrane-anchored ribosome-binding protein
MHYLTLDTNTWIYLANGTEPVKLLQYIKKEVDKKNITLLIPQTVFDEWEEKKTATIRQGVTKEFNDLKGSLDKMVKMLGDKAEPQLYNIIFKGEDEKEYFQQLSEKFSKKKKEIEEAVNDNIQMIDDLIKQNATIIPLHDYLFKKAGEFALAKKAPFKMKNSFADALIIFSLLDYLKTNSIRDALFVSYNTDDFCEKKDGTKTLHPDLKPELQEAECLFFKNVGEALNTIEKHILTEEELSFIQRKQEEENWSYEPDTCLVCEENHDRYTPVTYGPPVELLDEGLSQKANGTQASFDFSENTVQPLTDNPITTIEVGHCDWCGTEHFHCIHCGALNAVWDNEYNELKPCEGCGLNYLINREQDGDGIDEVTYSIPRTKETCELCGDEFYPEEMIEGLCQKCEHEYSYGKEESE